MSVVIKYITEAYASNPKIFVTAQDFRGSPKEHYIKEIVSEKIDGADYYVGYNFDGVEQFRYLSNAVNVHFHQGKPKPRTLLYIDSVKASIKIVEETDDPEIEMSKYHHERSEQGKAGIFKDDLVWVKIHDEWFLDADQSKSKRE